MRIMRNKPSVAVEIPAFSYHDVVETIRAHFSNTIFSYSMIHKSFGERYDVCGDPVEMFGERRVVAGLFKMDCYFGSLPRWEAEDIVFVKDIAYACDSMGSPLAVPLAPLVSHTLCMISAAAERGDESSIADILVGAVCHEMLYNIRHNGSYDPDKPDIAERRCLYLIGEAEKVLKNKKYRLWNRGHYYIYDLDYDNENRIMQELCADKPDGSVIGELIYKSVEHYIEDCRFEVICSKELSLALFRYEQGMYQYIRDIGIDKNVKENIADIEAYRSKLKELNNVPVSHDRNLPAVTDKRIDDFIERLNSPIIKREAYAMARYFWRDLGAVEDSHAGDSDRCSFDLYRKVKSEMKDVIQKLLNENDKNLGRSLSLISADYYTWDPPAFIDVEYDEDIPDYLLGGAFMDACINRRVLDDATMCTINHDVYNRSFTLSVRKAPRGGY